MYIFSTAPKPFVSFVVAYYVASVAESFGGFGEGCHHQPSKNQQFIFGTDSRRLPSQSRCAQAPIRCFPFSGLGYIAFKKYEFARRNHAWNKRCDALKLHADVVGQQNDAMKRWSELLDRIANVLKQAKALEHQDNALRRANALRLRADALGRRADEYLRSAKTFGLRAKALVERARAFSLQVSAFKPRLKFFEDSHNEFYGFGITERTHTGKCAATTTLLVPSCFVIFDLEPLSLSFYFGFSSEIFKSFPWFPAQSVRSSNADALDSPYLLVLITGISQSRQHGFPFVTVNTKEYHSECSGRITRIMRRTLVNSL
ncbi:hypothetical protein Tco_1079519 [Tanacetum coccineum]|uniref:Uncharacterized protein n=1 Tax=Tanacetum coccineum TaxID=301880 RepID=A0ABQ5HTD3_9ASTR